MDSPIIAVCTPQGGSGAIALLRICGTGAIELTDRMARLSSKSTLTQQKTHTIHHGHIIAKNGGLIDEVLFLLMKAPKTFTGQDTIEISCHNNPFIIQQIIQLAIQYGARQAQRGEFTKRAFLNKKIDLLQAEAINDLICAQTEIALKKSMAQLKGTLSHKIEMIETELVSLLSMVEASFEFLDEEQRDLDFDGLIREKVKVLIEETKEIIANFSTQQQIRQGIRIALLGSVNVGKSTLFNALVKKDRSIVTNSPGTTRDSVETSVYKNGNFLLFIDTAGLRETKDEIEQKGIDRTWKEAAESDIILLVHDATRELTKAEAILYKKIQKQFENKTIMVANKIDLLEKTSHKFVPVSAKCVTGIEQLEQEIERKIVKLFNKAQSPFLLNQRQYHTISQLNQKLQALASTNKSRLHYELVAYELKEMLETISQLTGKTVSERVMDNVFTSFCVGK